MKGIFTNDTHYNSNEAQSNDAGMENEKTKQAALKRGQRITLHKNKDSIECEHNGQEALVLEYPSRGPWMTVSTRGSVIKWRKSEYLVQYPSSAQQDGGKLEVSLNDDILCVIFTFLTGPSCDTSSDKEHVSVRKAKKLHNTFTSVCKRWRKACNNNMLGVFGLLSVDMWRLLSHQIVGYVHWMINHRVAIGSLKFYAHYGDILFLEKLFNVCDTSRLICLKADIGDCSKENFVDRSYNSPWVTSAYKHYIDNDVSLFSSENNPTLQRMTEALCVPYSSSRPKLRQLHDAIALNCESIKELYVNHTIGRVDQTCDERGVWDDVSKALFTMPSVKKLGMRVGICAGISVNINWVIESLVNLQELSLYAREAGTIRAIRITSKTLKLLDISHIGYNIYIFGDLPNLSTLDHNGPDSGIIPSFPGRQSQSNSIPKTFLAGEARMHELNLPPECKVIYSSSQTPYLIQEWMYEAVENARVF